MSDLTAIIGRNIKTMLAYNDKQQKDLAEYLGISKATVSEWISGKKSPRTNKIDDICEYLHCTVNDLTTEKMFTFTEFKNRTAKRELMELVEDMSDADVASVLAFYKTMRGLNESRTNK